MARPVLLLQFLARPLVWLLVRSSNLALRPFHDSTNFMESKLTREDLVAMVTEASGQSDLPAEAKEVLERAIDFAGLRVADVMVPRRWMVALPKNTSEGALRAALLETGHRRVPIYDGTFDAMSGYVLREDVMALLWDRKPIDIAALLRPCYFVPDTMTATKAMREMQARRLHLGIVVEETGSIAGIVTLEDLIEELVGEIFHERDVQVPEEARLEVDGVWLAPGRLGVRDFVRLAKVDLEAPDEVRTLGGLMVHLAGGTLPAQGAVLEAAPGITLEAVEVSVRRVRLVRARIDRRAVPAPR
jgi:putative hemolysin